MMDTATGDASTCLWFDGQAERAARFYVSDFPDGRLGRIGRLGAVITAGFEWRDRPLICFRGPGVLQAYRR